ncbi:MAG: hypothetical protein ACUVS7_15155 [Bryobacteraceae bacterium]
MGKGSLPKKLWGNVGRPLSLLPRTEEHRPVLAWQLVLERSEKAWRMVS